MQALFATREIEHFRKLFISFFLLLSRLLLVMLLLHFDEMYDHLQLAGNILCVNLTDVQYRKKWIPE